MTLQDDWYLRLLRTDGIAPVNSRFNSRPIRAHLDGCAVYNSHVQVYSDQTPRPLDRTLAPCACYSMADAINAGILKAALPYIPIAQDYLGQEPILYSVNAWWSFPGWPPKHDTQDWHRDDDDTKFLALFMFLNDVGPDGDHQFIRGSHKDPRIEVNPILVERVHGPAGTAFMADTRGLHRGLPPNHPRLIAWARFGVSDPPKSYLIDKLSPVDADVPMTETERRICRLVIR